MTWTRLHDGWVDDPVFEGLDHAVRWHYLAMIQLCSRTGRYDGIVTRDVTRRCSDVPNPDAAITLLTMRGLVEPVDDEHVRVLRIDDHVPPPYLRDEQRKPAQAARKRRSRDRRRGESVAREVARDTGTGQDRALDGTTSPTCDARTRAEEPTYECSSCGKHSSFTLTGGVCRRCRFDGKAAS